MAGMSYADFCEYLPLYLWKVGDSQLLASCDQLIKQAEAMLNREVADEARQTSVRINVNSQNEPLPADYRTMRQVVDSPERLGEFSYVSPAEIETLRAKYPDKWSPVYSIIGNYIMFAGPAAGGSVKASAEPPLEPIAGDIWVRDSVEPTREYVWTVDTDSAQWVETSFSQARRVEPKSITIYYGRKIGGYKEAGKSWFQEQEPDIFLYAVLAQTAPFLREDERLATWVGLYKDGIEKLREQAAFTGQRGTYDSIPLATSVSGRTSIRRSKKTLRRP